MNSLAFHWDEAEAFTKDQKAQKKLLKQWTHTAKAFGIYHLMVIGEETAIPVLGDIEVKIEFFDNYHQIRKAYPKSKYVVITEEGKDVEKVKFPSGDVIYVVGSNYSNPATNKGDVLVSIKANIPLWDVVAAGIVLYKAQ